MDKHISMCVYVCKYRIRAIERKIPKIIHTKRKHVANAKSKNIQTATKKILFRVVKRLKSIQKRKEVREI